MTYGNEMKDFVCYPHVVHNFLLFFFLFFLPHNPSSAIRIVKSVIEQTYKATAITTMAEARKKKRTNPTPTVVIIRGIEYLNGLNACMHI